MNSQNDKKNDSTHKKREGVNKHQSAAKRSAKYTYLLSGEFPLEEIILGETKRNVLEFIYKGGNPHSISKELKIARSTTIQHLQELRKKGLTKKGHDDKGRYGEPWLITKKGCHLIEKSVGFPVKSSPVTKITPQTPPPHFRMKQDSVRGHAFMFKLAIPKNQSWEKREERLKQKEIQYKKLSLFGGGEGIEFKGRKIHLTSKSIIVYEKESFISETAKKSKSRAIHNFLRLIKNLERKLNYDFSFKGRYKFRVSRQHYALIKNALATQYEDEKKKLHVYTDEGLWFLIDNSFNLNEAETVHPRTGVKDNEKVQNFFNSLKKDPLTTTEIKSNFNEVKEMIKESSENQIQLSQLLKQMQGNLIQITKIIRERK